MKRAAARAVTVSEVVGFVVVIVIVYFRHKAVAWNPYFFSFVADFEKSAPWTSVPAGASADKADKDDETCGGSHACPYSQRCWHIELQNND